MLCLLVKPFAILGRQNDISTRRAQLSEYLNERENAVAEEIRQAATALNNRTQLVALASARERSWAEKVNDIRSRQQQGLASFAEVASANLDWFKARGDVIQEVMAWHIAWVKLRQAQGLFPSDCRNGGYCR
jgi:outer membrane protein TolC